jgi:hypothetical protein
VASAAGVPTSTARGWCRRFAARAEEIRALFTRLAFALDEGLVEIAAQMTVAGDAVEAIGVAARAADVRFGEELSPWRFVSKATGGALLCNTRSHLALLR